MWYLSITICLWIGIIIYIRCNKQYAFNFQKARQETEKILEESQNALEEILKRHTDLVLKMHDLSFQLETKNAEIKAADDLLREKKNSLDREETLYREIIQRERDCWYAEYEKKQEEQLQLAAKEFATSFMEDNQKKVKAAQELTKQLSTLRSSVASATEMAKHNLEDEMAQAFYCLDIPEDAIRDIERIQEIGKDIHSSVAQEAINKVIWKVYFEKPYTDLIGRVCSNKPIMGIYKITNLKNNMLCYVGQAVNISERWKQHIKRGLGAETRTQNKLYPAMEKYGLQNFSFEVIEILQDRTQLDEREDYWQDFYKAKEFGYSIK